MDPTALSNPAATQDMSDVPNRQTFYGLGAGLAAKKHTNYSQKLQLGVRPAKEEPEPNSGLAPYGNSLLHYST